MNGIVMLIVIDDVARASAGFSVRAIAALEIGRDSGKKMPLMASGKKSLQSSRWETECSSSFMDWNVGTFLDWGKVRLEGAGLRKYRSKRQDDNRR